jgi:hypothetical protein
MVRDNTPGDDPRPTATGGKPGPTAREMRQARALRDNLVKRKNQARRRTESLAKDEKREPYG